MWEAISRIRISCSVALILVGNASADASEFRLQHQRIWAQYAKELGKPDAPRLFESQYYLPGTQFESRDEGIQNKADEYAKQLIALARGQLAADPALAYRLLHEAAFFGRENLADRIVQGTSKLFQSKLASSTHPRLKWKRREYYRITSEHYQVVSRDEAAGREIAERLETLYAVWRQLFFDCWSDQAALRRAIDREKTLAPSTRRLHRVVLFPDQQQYTQFLQKAQPRIGITKGFYDISSRTSYFYDSEPKNITTQLHEVTHQLFQELQRVSERLPLQRNFWVLEGVAMYMESLRRHDHLVTLGGFAARRLQFARYRRLHEDFYVPLQELVAMGRDAFQRDPRIRRLYSQSAGLTHWMIDVDRGLHRRGFIAYLKSIYEGRDRDDSLTSSLGLTTAEIDVAYLGYLHLDDRRLVEHPVPADSLQSLCLGQTAITNAGLQRLTPQRKLEWLDLARLPVQANGLAFIGETKTLRQVSLDQCAMAGDDVVALLAQNPELDELDLTATAVTDVGLKHLAGHKKLQTLWIGGTRLTDASLPVLLSLPSLTQLQCSGTEISPSALARLRQAKPNLEIEQ